VQYDPSAIVAELVAEQVKRPVRIFAAAQRFADQHSMPDNLLVFSVSVLSCVPANYEPELAIRKIDVAGFRLGNPPARATRRLDHDGFARRALAQRGGLAALALFVRRGCGAAVDIERPLDMVLRAEKITSTLELARSAANSASRSWLPSAHR
jgi:hypothetical protein